MSLLDLNLDDFLNSQINLEINGSVKKCSLGDRKWDVVIVILIMIISYVIVIPILSRINSPQNEDWYMKSILKSKDNMNNTYLLFNLTETIILLNYPTLSNTNNSLLNYMWRKH